MRLALALVLAIIATAHNAGASAQKATPEVRTLSGEWTFSAEGYVMPLSLRQDGTRVTGTLEGFHGSFPLQGEFRKGLIHFAGSSDGGGIRHSDDSNDIDLFAVGTLQPDGSLQGTLVSTVGNLTWHAERKTVHPGGPSSKHLHHSDHQRPAPVTFASRSKNPRFRCELIAQFTGTLW